MHGIGSVGDISGHEGTSGDQGPQTTFSELGRFAFLGRSRSPYDEVLGEADVSFCERDWDMNRAIITEHISIIQHILQVELGTLKAPTNYL